MKKSDDELLDIMHSVLKDAIFEAEFHRRPSDLEYAQYVANRLEELRAKIKGTPLVSVSLMLIDGRIVAETELRGFSIRRKA